METRVYQAMFFADDLAQFVNLKFNWILLRCVNRPYIFFSRALVAKKNNQVIYFHSGGTIQMDSIYFSHEAGEWKKTTEWKYK